MKCSEAPARAALSTAVSPPGVSLCSAGRHVHVSCCESQADERKHLHSLQTHRLLSFVFCLMRFCVLLVCQVELSSKHHQDKKIIKSRKTLKYKQGCCTKLLKDETTHSSPFKLKAEYIQMEHTLPTCCLEP